MMARLEELHALYRSIETVGVPVVAALTGWRSAAATSSRSPATAASRSTTRASRSGCPR